MATKLTARESVEYQKTWRRSKSQLYLWSSLPLPFKPTFFIHDHTTSSHHTTIVGQKILKNTVEFEVVHDYVLYGQKVNLSMKALDNFLGDILYFHNLKYQECILSVLLVPTKWYICWILREELKMYTYTKIHIGRSPLWVEHWYCFHRYIFTGEPSNTISVMHSLLNFLAVSFVA